MPFSKYIYIKMCSNAVFFFPHYIVKIWNLWFLAVLPIDEVPLQVSSCFWFEVRRKIRWYALTTKCHYLRNTKTLACEDSELNT